MRPSPNWRASLRHGATSMSVAPQWVGRGDGWGGPEKKTLRATEQTSAKAHAARKAFVQRVEAIPPERLIFVDEFGTNLAMTRPYAWAPSGVRAYGTVPGDPGTNITLTLGLRLDGVVAPFAFEGSTDGVAFQAYIEHQLAPNLKPGDVVVLDNLPVHHKVSVAPALRAVGAEVLYLPPYSPDLSPVEECGSKVKAWIRAEAPRTPTAVYDAMGHAIGAVTSSDAHGWFGHRGGYCPKRE
jgi:transposase